MLDNYEVRKFMLRNDKLIENPEQEGKSSFDNRYIVCWQQDNIYETDSLFQVVCGTCGLD